MARRSRKLSRWPIALAELLLLSRLFVPAAHAAAAADAAPASEAAANASAPGSMAAATLDPPDAMAAVDGADLYLETTLNGTDRGLAHFGYRDGTLWATHATLQQLGFVVAATAPDPLRLDTLRGVRVQYDDAQQSASIVADLNFG